MAKKLITPCMALAVFVVFVLPATALAATAKDAEGTVAVGSTVIGERVAGTEATLVTTAGSGLIHATSATLTGKVLRNDSGSVEITISEAKFSGTGSVNAHNNLSEVTGSFGNAYTTVELPVCIRLTLFGGFEQGTELNSRCNEGVGDYEITVGSTTAGACGYTSTNPVTGTFTTGKSEAEASVLTVNNTQAGSGSKLTSGGFLCPSSLQMKMSFSLKTSNGKKIWIE